MSDETPEALVQVGWYCWRCEGLNTQPCRSDCVPVHVPAEWASEMAAEIARLEEEPDEPAAHDDGPTVAEATADDRAHWPERQWGGS